MTDLLERISRLDPKLAFDVDDIIDEVQKQRQTRKFNWIRTWMEKHHDQIEKIKEVGYRTLPLTIQIPFILMALYVAIHKYPSWKSSREMDDAIKLYKENPGETLRVLKNMAGMAGGSPEYQMLMSALLKTRASNATMNTTFDSATNTFKPKPRS